MVKNIEEVSMRFHPRAFSAFGADLVTNDSVAITELVKNSYDAFANNVIVSITGDTIEIRDDGSGMTRDIIKDAWAVIATPYKEKKPTVEKNGKIRRVSGNKGLGRFSAARLGRFLDIITKNSEDKYISAKIDWESFVNSSSMSECKVTLTIHDSHEELEDCGTIIRISSLYEKWDSKKINELKNSLSRLISPFDEISDFSITLNHESYATPIKITPHKFIKHPTYSISGTVDSYGKVSWKYIYAPRIKPITEKNGNIAWDEARRGFEAIHLFDDSLKEEYIAGEFSFEIRAWDLDTDSIADVSDAFNIGRREIRNSISEYKGLSIYRDNVLVLPKSDATKDWLGIDIRRISQIGRRLSTSQIIGLVNISSEFNPEIKDTTDREKLVDTIEYKQFCKIIETVIVTLENQRFIDKAPKVTPVKKKGLNDLISPLSTAPLVSKIEEAVNEGKNSEQILDTVRVYAEENEKTLIELNDRLTYYAQTASLGSVAVVILHEILTGMTVIKRFLKRIKTKFSDIDEKTQEYLQDSETYHARLVEVANSFAPLYRKTLREENNYCNLKEEVSKSIRLISSKKEAKDIEFSVNIDQKIDVSISCGELQTILVNLFDNSIFWINYSKKAKKQVCVSVDGVFPDKIRLSVSDSGLGISHDEADKIFLPGITSKPHGIGMGLVIVTEILSNYDCKIGTVIPGELNGATFVFELPIKDGGGV